MFKFLILFIMKVIVVMCCLYFGNIICIVGTFSICAFFSVCVFVFGMFIFCFLKNICVLYVF